MPTETEFCLLGPFMVCSGGVPVLVQRGKQRAVLAALLLEANREVSLDALAEALWGPAPPPSARVTVQNYVVRLRKALGEGDRNRIRTQPGGYLITVDPGELDVRRFEDLLGAARSAARDGSWQVVAASAGAALALWRGEPLEGVESEVLAAREIPRLSELRYQALESRIDADLHLGRHAEVIAELRMLAGRHPLREPLHAQLMLALYRDGRQAEALIAYQNARRVLIEELGTEPGNGLRDLYQQILTADPALAITEPVSPTAGAPVVISPGQITLRQLPPTARHFTGRTGELTALTGLLGRSAGQAPGTVVISAISGTAGVGKTALAVHWAHQVAERFPDGQLFMNLRGYDPAQPMPAADALAGFLRALGVPGQDIPPEEAGRAALYRSLLAGRRMMVVLDNAGSAEQVRPLLPAAPHCVAVVTSRDSLAGLVARDGAHRLDLDVLTLAEATTLLRVLIGGRVDADPASAATLAAQCSRLPLALRVTAELASARPAVPLADLVIELADEQRRLDLMEAGGDERTAVRAVFSWSYQRLDTDTGRAFQLAGLHPGPDLDPYAAAALTGSSLQRAHHFLGQLARAHLIQPARPGRHAMHDLLRAYAREVAAAETPEADRQAALTRLFDYYLSTAAGAIDTLFPAERDRRPPISRAADPAPPLTDPDAARGWLDAERETLVAVVVHMAAGGWPDHATRLAATLSRYLVTCDLCPEAAIIHGHARQAARETEDRAAEATALTSLGLVDMQQGCYPAAAGKFRQALTLFRETHDRNGEAQALHSLAMTDFRQGSYQQAVAEYQQALTLFRETGSQRGEARALGNLGVLLGRLGRRQEAMDHYQLSLALQREIGDQSGEIITLLRLGNIDLQSGRYPEATDRVQRALALSRESGEAESEAEALTLLGEVELVQGQHQRAGEYQRQALAMFRETRDVAGEVHALTGLGAAVLAAGQPGDAVTQYSAAADLADQIGDKSMSARAHNGLGHAHHADGNPSQGRYHWHVALTLYTDLGVPEAEQVRALLGEARNSLQPDAGRSDVAAGKARPGL
jgi:DNA-binding SARP family transcriptional activator/tetratricopeptide (TPR) repeat protein